MRGIFALLVTATGLTLAFLGDWWSRGGWIWGGIVAYVAILGVIGYHGRGKLAGLRAMKDDQLMEAARALVVFKPL